MVKQLELKDWWPWYRRIVETFGYDQEDDQAAADLLSKLLAGKAADPSQLKKKVANHAVLVFGAGPSLEEDLRQAMREGFLKRFTTFVADGATTALLHVAKTVPDVIVTDLDGIISDIISAQRQGSMLVVHAHGDNIEQLQRYVPELPCAFGSTQVEPRPNVYNFLGFTDGDRAVFLAVAMEAKMIVLAGMDFGLAVGKYSKSKVKSLAVKQKKLKISRELLEWLAEKIQGDIALYNLTTNGEKVRGFRSIQPEDLRKLV